jgi:hypothetical protein
MYSLNMPVSKLRTKVREEFEKHRYVRNLAAVDILLQQNHAEFQVRMTPNTGAEVGGNCGGCEVLTKVMRRRR